MKKWFLLSLFIVITNILSADVVNPIGDVNITVDPSASQIELKAVSSSERLSLSSTAQLESVIEVLPVGNYELEFKVDGIRNKINFTKD